MPRKMIVRLQDGSQPVLEEASISYEVELQELVKDNPDLLPIEEFGLAGPLMVVGRETELPSGAVDLVALSPSGELLVVEFKTGPKNTDFRAVIAQLLDYGSDLWGQSFAAFEQAVAVRYFASSHCRAPSFKGTQSLQAAADACWPEQQEEERSQAFDRLSTNLRTGRFHYLVVAQRFVPSVERTLDYMNAIAGGPRFYGVELVGFEGDGVRAFESRTLVRPRPQSVGGNSVHVNERALLESISDEAYRQTISDFLSLARGLGLKDSWGTVGVSLRVPTPDRPDPLSVCWIFPPGKSGWAGLTDVTFGFDPGSARQTPSVAPALAAFVDKLAAVPGAQAPRPNWMKGNGWNFSAAAFVAHHHELSEVLAEFVADATQADQKGL